MASPSLSHLSVVVFVCAGGGGGVLACFDPPAAAAAAAYICSFSRLYVSCALVVCVCILFQPLLFASARVVVVLISSGP